jgi:glycosyltransferase involved in cell wall biosynthesis
LKPRVVHALEAFAGGTERHLLDLVEHVPDVEHVVAVPSTHLGRPTASAAHRAQRLGAIVEIVEMGRSAAPHRGAAAIGSMRSLIRRYRPAIVHGHSSIGGTIGRLAATATGVPVVYTPNGLARMQWALVAERYLAPRTDWFIAVSEGEREFALEQGLARPERITTIPNGIDLRPPSPLVPSLRQRLGIPEHAPLAGCVGRLTWQKAPEVYVAACELVGRQLPQAHFVLIGSGPLRETVQQMLEAARLGGRFHWLDALPGAASALGELDLYVLPSRFEGGPYTPLEAMRAGTPVILTDVAGNRDTVEHGVTGMLVPVDEPVELGRAMVHLLANPDHRAACAAAAADRLRASFDVRAAGGKTARVYERVASAPREPLNPLRRVVERALAVGTAA